MCVSKSIGLACGGREIYHFCFVLLCIRGQIPSTRPPGGLYSGRRFNGGFFAIWGGIYLEAYTWRGSFSEFYGMLNEEHFTFHLQELFYPKNPKMCDSILVTLVKMWPHYNQSRRENATPSSSTSPLVSYKEVPFPPPPGRLLVSSENGHRQVRNITSKEGKLTFI